MILQMSSKQKVFITKATVLDTFVSKTLCFPLICFYKCLPNKRHSLHKLQFWIRSYHKICASFSCAFTNVLQTKSIHYTSYNTGHILIVNFVLSSCVLLQMSSKKSIYNTSYNSGHVLIIYKICALISFAFSNVFQTKNIHYTSYNSAHIRIFVLSSYHNENYKTKKNDIFSKPFSRFKTSYIVLKVNPSHLSCSLILLGAAHLQSVKECAWRCHLLWSPFLWHHLLPPQRLMHSFNSSDLQASR